MPEPFDAPGDAPDHELRLLPNYAPEEPPVFFGHYWLSSDRARIPLAPNLACLDFSAARADYPLVGYRWEGERVLKPENFVSAAL